MKYALAVNIGIIVLILVALLVLKNPLALLAIVLLREMPYELLLPPEQEEPEEGEPCMGFHADVE